MGRTNNSVDIITNHPCRRITFHSTSRTFSVVTVRDDVPVCVDGASQYMPVRSRYVSLFVCIMSVWMLLFVLCISIYVCVSLIVYVSRWTSELLKPLQLPIIMYCMWLITLIMNIVSLRRLLHQLLPQTKARPWSLRGITFLILYIYSTNNSSATSVVWFQ